MTDLDATQFKQQAFAAQKPVAAKDENTSKPIEDLSDTAKLFDLDPASAASPAPVKKATNGKSTKAAKSPSPPLAPRKRGTRLEEPEMSVATAIEQGLSKEKVDDLLDLWKKYRRQQANDEAKADANALQAQVAKARRKIADELLAMADKCNCSMEVARATYKAALKSKFPKADLD